MRKTIETTDAPELVLEANGDLEIEGDDELVVTLECDDDNADVRAEGNRIIVTCHSDCELTVPQFARVFVKAVGGDAKIEEVTGPIELGPVGGDLRVSECGAVKAHSVGGDCKFDECDGPVSVGSVGGDLRAAESAFGGRSVNVGGDASMQLADLTDESFTINAGGDVSVELPEGASARVDINDSEGTRRIMFGEGGASVRINAGGDVSVSRQGEEEDDIHEVVTRSVDEAMRTVDQELSAMQRNLENMTRDFSERFAGVGVPAWKAERAQAKAEAAARRVEGKLRQRMAKLEERARREAERTARKAERSAARQGKRYTWTGAAPRPPEPPQPPSFSNAPFEPPQPPRQVTDEERMLILRMLQDKKITTEQAEQLLSALER